MSTVTVYVSDGLHARLKARKDIINMSKVCSRALEREVDILDSMSEGDPLARIRASRREGSIEEGLEAGKKWAIEKASFTDALRVSYFYHLAADNDLDVSTFGIERHGKPVAALTSDAWCLGFSMGAEKVIEMLEDES